MELLQRTELDARALREQLNRLTHQELVTWSRQLPRKQFARLYDLATANTLTLDYFVPKETDPMVPVHHIGVNDLPLFRPFEKVMYRTAEGRVAGRNVQTFEWFTGPGYFFAQELNGEIVLDYNNVPQEVPNGWPASRSNMAGFSRFVFGNMVDAMRQLADHVTIGSAAKGGKDIDQYFILVRKLEG